jgi:phage shock protein PspC (stress-responsive transcriptional regulator)
MATFPIEQPLALVSRSRKDRWLGGVCAGLARGRGINPAWIRGAFVVAALFAGLGALAYIACWLVIPQEGAELGSESSRWLVRLAKACAACLALLMLAGLAAVATLFGFGWVAGALAAGVLLVVLLTWPRLGPAWALLPLAAVALPTAAVAASGVQFVASAGHVTIAPRALAPGGLATFRAGLGTTLVDLRHTSLPTTGTLNVRVEGGVRRTIVALPHDTCVHVDLAYSVAPFWGQVASLLAGRPEAPGVVLFGNYLPGRSGARRLITALPGPVLKLDFTSAGGSLYVRDYPDTVDPDLSPNWPGYPVIPEARPDVRGIAKGAARSELRAWQVRHAAEVSSQQLVDFNLSGPCATRVAPG